MHDDLINAIAIGSQKIPLCVFLTVLPLLMPFITIFNHSSLILVQDWRLCSQLV